VVEHEVSATNLTSHLLSAHEEALRSMTRSDKALHTALDLIRGIQKNSAYPPNPKTAVPN